MAEKAPPFQLKPKLNRSALPIVAWNMAPIAGVAFLKWDPINVFICYAMETIVIGLINIFKIAVVSRYGLPPDDNEKGMTSGPGAIIFFSMHYYFFVFLQLSLFFNTLPNNHTGGPANALEKIILFANSSTSNLALPVYILSSLSSLVNDFMLTHVYNTRTVGQQMFEPYPRIFVQQFVVIIGSFLFTMSGTGWAVLIVLVLVKTYFDLVLKDVSLSELAVKKNNQAR
jgi:hypothetical protein